MAGKAPLEIEWEQVDDALRVTIWGRFTAADHRSIDISYLIDVEREIITCHCRVSLEGRTYRHQSVLRGFCLIPIDELKGLDPNACDWQAVVA